MATLFTLPNQVRIGASGAPYAGASVTFYQAGTLTLQSVYRDNACSLAHSNPVEADSAGQFPVVFLNPNADSDYRIIIKSSAGVTLDDEDDIPRSPFTQAQVGQLIYPQTDAETDADVTPVNYQYPVGYVDRYGDNTSPGTTDMSDAVNSAFKVAKTAGHDVIFGATWPYRLAEPIDATQDANEDNFGYCVRNIGQAVANTENAPGYPCILADHTGHVFDCAGASAINWHDISVGTPAGADSPQTCWFLARNSLGSSQYHRFTNCRVRGSFSEAVIYNYASEDCTYAGCVFYNTHEGDNTAVVDISAFNIRNLESTFITVATGQRSCLDHEFIGGQFVNVTDSATGDVFRLDGVGGLSILATWMACANSTGGGRSLIFADTTNTLSANVTLIGLLGEVSAPVQNTYGIYCSGAATTMSHWVVLGCRLPNVTAMLATAASVNFNGLRFQNTNNAGIGAGVIIGGSLANSACDSNSSGITAGSFSENNVDLLSKVIEVAGEARLTLRDTAGGTNEKNWMLRSTGTDLVFSGFNDARDTAITPLQLGRTGTTTSKIGFHGTSPLAKPAITGSRGGNAALASLLTAGANYGLWTDSTTA